MKIALCTIVNDPFIAGAEVMIKSFLVHNLSWFNGDIYFVHSNNLSPLSQENIARLQNLSNNIKSWKADEHPYESINMVSAQNNRFRISYLTLEAFKIEGYDKVLFLDSDILVTGDIKSYVDSDMFTATPNSLSLYTTESVVSSNRIQDYLYVNGGAFCIPKKFLGITTFDKLINIAKPGWKKCDQDVINEWLRKDRQHYRMLSNKYNLMIKGLRIMKRTNYLHDDIRILHYAGKYKPWKCNPVDPFQFWEKPWFDFHKEYFK